MNQEPPFDYHYSAKTQSEVRRIREKYLPNRETTLETLCRLDAGAEKKGTVWSVAAGVVGTLTLGGGMSLAMVGRNLAWGIALGAVGIFILSCAYPLYQRITKRERERIAPEILRLTDMLMEKS